MAQRSTHHHGDGRGAEDARRSQQFEGRFGRLFRSLPPASFSREALAALGDAMISPPQNAPTPENQVDSKGNAGISAGYTYLGQFIEHDLTFDPASSLMKQNDPDALTTIS